MKRSQKLHAFSWLGVILSIIVLAIFGFIGAKATLDYIYCKELQATVDKGVIVEGKITDLVHRAVSVGSGTTYYIRYRYTDKLGLIYEGYCGNGTYSTEAEDLKRIGEKIEIYIGLNDKGQPLSWPVSYGSKISVSTDIALMSVFYSAIVLYIIAVILYCLFFYNKLAVRKKKFDNTENKE